MVKTYDLKEHIAMSKIVKADKLDHDIGAAQGDIDEIPWVEGIDVDVAVEHGTVILFFDDYAMRICLQVELVDLIDAIFPDLAVIAHPG